MTPILSKNFFAILCLSIFLSSCEQGVKNSTIPQKYVAAAQKFSGIYYGQFDGRSVSLKILIANSGFVTIESENPILGNCESKIGALVAVSGDKKNQTLKSARFALDNSGCNIEGHDLFLEVAKNGSLNMTIIKSSFTWTTSKCTGSGIDRECTDDVYTTYEYLTGNVLRY